MDTTSKAVVVVCTNGVGVNPVLLLSVVASTEGDLVVASTIGG